MLVHRRLRASLTTLLLSLALLLSWALPVAVVAGGPQDSWGHAMESQGSSLQLAVLGPRVKQQRASSAAEAARIAKRRYGGKVLKVETVKHGDQVRYRVKILLDNGRVKTVVIGG